MAHHRSIRCMLGFHVWESRENEDGESYQTCGRCGKDGDRLSPFGYLSDGFSPEGERHK